MAERLCIVGNIEDESLIDPIVKAFEKDGRPVEMVYPEATKASWLSAPDARDVIICITNRSGRYVYEVSEARMDEGKKSIWLYLEHTLHDTRQKRALKGNIKVDALANPDDTVAELNQYLGPKPELPKPKVETPKPEEETPKTATQTSQASSQTAQQGKRADISSMLNNLAQQSLQKARQTPTVGGKPAQNKPADRPVQKTRTTTTTTSFNTQKPASQTYSSSSTGGGKNKKIIWILLGLILFGGGIFWWVYYDNVYLPAKIDREAERTYPIVNVFLRSSKMAGGDFNKITSIPGSSELITYDNDGEWARVKYIPQDGNEKPMEGYVASDYLLNKKDMYQLTSILADNDAREVLATAKVRKGLVNYFKEKGITGALSYDVANEIGLPYDPYEQWQVVMHKGQAKPNEVLFKRVFNRNSKFTDLAVILENVATGAKKVVYFTYDDDETPHFRGEADYYNGAIKDMRLVGNKLEVIDQNGYITYVPVNRY